MNLLVLLAAAVAVAMSRRAPGEALLVAWLVALVQVLTGGDRSRAGAIHREGADPHDTGHARTARP